MVFSWQNAAQLLLLRRLISIRIGCSVPVWASPWISDRHLPKPVLAISLPGLRLPRPYDQALVSLPASNAAPSKPGLSVDGRSSTSNVSSNHPELIRAYADVPSQRFAAVATIQANHIVMMYGSPH